MARRSQFSLRTLLLLTLVAAMSLSFCMWLYRNLVLECYRVVTFRCARGREIVITADTSWERSQGVYYCVKDGGTTVVPESMFDSIGSLAVIKHSLLPSKDHEVIEYRLVTSEEGELTGIVSSRGDGCEVLVLHDFGTGESWPSSAPLHRDSALRKWLIDAFDRLQAENPALHMSEVEEIRVESVDQAPSHSLQTDNR